MELLSTNVSFEGEHRRYRHTSATLECDMEFAVYLPPGPETGRAAGDGDRLS